jgi:predicted nucleic acid-binding protein
MKVAANTFVLDASMALAWCFDDESNDLAEDILDSLKGGSQAITPGIWPLEVANVLLMAERRKRISLAKIMEQLGEIRKLPIIVEPADSPRAFDQILAVARQLRLTVYDAAYLELAMRRALPLATLDDSLGRAARAAGIPLVSV